MPIFLIVGIGGALCGWSVLLVLAGERQRKLSALPSVAPPVEQKKKN